MAVDREAMLRNVFGDRGQRSFGPFPRATSVADTTLALPPYDTAAAAALLDSAGWLRGPDGMRRKGGRPLAFSLLTPQSSKPRMSYAVLLQEQLRRIGARVDIETLDFPSFTARRSSRRFDAVLQGWNADPGPGGIAQRWSSANIDQGPNDEAYQNPRFDAYLDSASASFDPATMQRHMRTAFEQLIADAPAIWLYEPLTLAGIHQRIRPRPMPARGWWTHIADWHIPANARIARDGVGLATRSP